MNDKGVGQTWKKKWDIANVVSEKSIVKVDLLMALSLNERKFIALLVTKERRRRIKKCKSSVEYESLHMVCFFLYENEW